MNRDQLVTWIKRLTLLALLIGFAAVPAAMAFQQSPTGPVSGGGRGSGGGSGGC